MFCQPFEFVGSWGYFFPMKEVNKAFIKVCGFLSDEFPRQEIGMGWGRGQGSLNDFVLLTEIGDLVSVVRDIDCLFCPIDGGVGYL